LSTFEYITFDAAEAKIWLITICEIESRKELDTSVYAEFAFHEYVRKPYMAWIENAC
jgi:hypothetical protein